MSEKLNELHYEIDFQKKISRWFIFRFLWIFIEMWVLWVWTIWVGIIFFLHFWYMLLLGQRHQGLWQRQLRYVRHLAKWGSYFQFMVNKRPKFIED